MGKSREKNGFTRVSKETYSQSYTCDRYGNRFKGANSTQGLPAVSASEINAATNRFIDSGATPTITIPPGTF
jgi:hypothetical protein